MGWMGGRCSSSGRRGDMSCRMLRDGAVKAVWLASLNIIRGRGCDTNKSSVFQAGFHLGGEG